MSSVHLRMKFISRILKNDDIATPDLTLRQERQLAAARIKDKLVYQEVIANQDRILHRPGRDGDGLQNERHSKQSHYQRDDKGFKILTRGRFRRPEDLRFFVHYFVRCAH